MTACAARALGSHMQGHLAPQRGEERTALQSAGISIDRVLDLDDLVSAEATFLATGVTGGLLAAPRREGSWTVTESLLVGAGAAYRISQRERTQE